MTSYGAIIKSKWELELTGAYLWETKGNVTPEGNRDRDCFAKEKSHQLSSKEHGTRFYLYVANQG